MAFLPKKGAALEDEVEHPDHDRQPDQKYDDDCPDKRFCHCCFLLMIARPCGRTQSCNGEDTAGAAQVPAIASRLIVAPLAGKR
jgi:hypothetical protein